MYYRIRALREDNDLTQTAVAQMLGMSQTGYSKYETGENDIPTSILIRLSVLYDTSIDYLLGITDYRRPLPANIRRISNYSEYHQKLKDLKKNDRTARNGRS